MKAVVFDLDDTLYPEIEFVRSGFTAVAEFVAERFGIAPATTFKQLMLLLRSCGRDKIFQRLLGIHNLPARPTWAEMLWVYRTHSPVIRLYGGACELLEQLTSHGIRLGLITDGKASVQHRKIDALGVRDWFQCIVVTDDVGSRFAKPNRAAYDLVLGQLRCDPTEAVYIGDDPRKDFIVPNQIGMHSIQAILPNQGLAAGVVPESPEQQPRSTIQHLTEITSKVIRSSAA